MEKSKQNIQFSVIAGFGIASVIMFLYVIDVFFFDSIFVGLFSGILSSIYLWKLIPDKNKGVKIFVWFFLITFSYYLVQLTLKNFRVCSAPWGDICGTVSQGYVIAGFLAVLLPAFWITTITNPFKEISFWTLLLFGPFLFPLSDFIAGSLSNVSWVDYYSYEITAFLFFFFWQTGLLLLVAGAVNKLNLHSIKK